MAVGLEIRVGFVLPVPLYHRDGAGFGGRALGQMWEG